MEEHCLFLSTHGLQSAYTYSPTYAHFGYLKKMNSCMSLYMRWPLRNFYTFHHLVDFYRNTIPEWAVGFRYGNFTLKLAHGKAKPCLPQGYSPWEASFSSRGLIFGGEEISIPETWPIRKSYISS